MSDLHLQAIDPQTETKKITEFIKSTFQKAGKTNAVIALSGGIDSAASLALTSQALDPQNIHVLLLPSLQSSEKDTHHAHYTAEYFGVPTGNITEINLAAIQEAFAKTLKLYTSPNQSFERLGNIAARIRMILVYDQAKAKDALVVGTENRSEELLGYYTRFGDEASDLEPIQHLYKTQVYSLAAHLKVPEDILVKAPTAGLWADQTDEAELGFTYLAADPILYQHFDKHLSAENIASLGFDPTLILKVLTHADSVAFKHAVPYHL